MRVFILLATAIVFDHFNIDVNLEYEGKVVVALAVIACVFQDINELMMDKK